MVITCPSCSSAYRVKREIGKRGARITCPACAHDFVAYPPTVEQLGTFDLQAPEEEPPIPEVERTLPDGYYASIHERTAFADLEIYEGEGGVNIPDGPSYGPVAPPPEPSEVQQDDVDTHPVPALVAEAGPAPKPAPPAPPALSESSLNPKVEASFPSLAGRSELRRPSASPVNALPPRVPPAAEPQGMSNTLLAAIGGGAVVALLFLCAGVGAFLADYPPQAAALPATPVAAPTLATVPATPVAPSPSTASIQVEPELTEPAVAPEPEPAVAPEPEPEPVVAQKVASKPSPARTVPAAPRPAPSAPKPAPVAAPAAKPAPAEKIGGNSDLIDPWAN